MRAIVLAGGLGTRLRPVVADVPKPLAPVAGRPFLSILLDRLEAGGVDEAVLAVGHRREAIIDRFGERHGGIRLRYAIETAPLGTGGGLRNAAGMVAPGPVLVVNGDTLLDIDHAAVMRAHRDGGRGLTMVLRRVADAGRYGRVVVGAGRVVAFAAAGGGGPGLINSGVYVLDPAILDDAPPGPFSFEKDFLEPRIAALKPLAVETDGYFIDIGVPEDYRRAQTELAAP